MTKLHPAEQDCFVFAARYAHTRNTGAAFMVVNAILHNWDKLDKHIQKQLKEEALNEAMFNMDDWNRIITR